ncbi:MAG: ATP-binding protein [Archangium sp.]|nr:ATP-binding protein [Archangium sp.]
MFFSSTPATADAFFDRQQQLTQLEGAVKRLVRGAPQWVAILGSRKVGKTSLMLELQRRVASPRLRFVVLDSFEEHPLSFEVFRRLALRTLDAFFADELGVSLLALSRTPSAYRAVWTDSKAWQGLDRGLRAEILDVAERKADEKLAEFALGLADRLATALKVHCVVAWDEFQEIGRLDSSRATGVLPLARALWQRHKRTTYFVSGSERALLRRLVEARDSPFFQHFSLMELGPMGLDDAVALLLRNAKPARGFGVALARRLAELLGGQPFYLQVVGEALMQAQPPFDEATVRTVLADVLFSRTGRLSLFFEREFQRVVGQASTLAATLDALADGPKRPTDVAKHIGASTGSVARYLERLGDLAVRRADGLYELPDPTFALWLRWRRPGGSVVPMSVIGDEAELAVAERLAEMGFELVYQSRASRGAFDLFAARGATLLGVQVKRSPLPLRWSKAAWQRMEADATRFGWRWCVAQVGPKNELMFLDPNRARSGKQVTLDQKAELTNVLAWLSAKP